MCDHAEQTLHRKRQGLRAQQRIGNAHEVALFLRGKHHAQIAVFAIHACDMGHACRRAGRLLHQLIAVHERTSAVDHAVVLEVAAIQQLTPRLFERIAAFAVRLKSGFGQHPAGHADKARQHEIQTLAGKRKGRVTQRVCISECKAVVHHDQNLPSYIARSVG